MKDEEWYTKKEIDDLQYFIAFLSKQSTEYCIKHNLTVRDQLRVYQHCMMARMIVLQMKPETACELFDKIKEIYPGLFKSIDLNFLI